MTAALPVPSAGPRGADGGTLTRRAAQATLIREGTGQTDREQGVDAVSIWLGSRGHCETDAFLRPQLKTGRRSLESDPTVLRELFPTGTCL